MNKETLVVDNMIKEANEISKFINLVNEKYKDIATKEDLIEFKKVILNSLNNFEIKQNIITSCLRIILDNKNLNYFDYIDLISKCLNVRFTDGFHKISAYYKNEVHIILFKDVIIISKSVNKKDDFLIYEVKDKILNELIKEINNSNITVNTTFLNGHTKSEYVSCNSYAVIKEEESSNIKESSITKELNNSKKYSITKEKPTSKFVKHKEYFGLLLSKLLKSN